MKFVKNITYMSFGNLFSLIIAFISSFILIRTIGTSGYAIIGIVFSLTSIVRRFDVSFYLSLVKTNKETLKKIAFEQSFNSMNLVILLSNVIILIIITPLAIFLSLYVYHESYLVIFYLWAIFRLLFARSSKFFENALRANKNEQYVQNAVITAITFEFVLTLFLLFVLHFGVMSIFIASFFSQCIRYFINLNRIKTIVNFKLFYSKNIIKKIFSQYAFPEYLSDIMTGILFSGSLFIATIILPMHELGILTIFISIMRKLSDFFLPLWYHLMPVFSRLKKGIKSNTLLSDLIRLPQFFITLVVIFLFTIGEHIYSLYFGIALIGTYGLFLIIMAGFLIFNGVIAARSMLYSKNAYLYVLIKFMVIALHLAFFIPVGKNFGLIGICVLYTIVFITYAIGILYKLKIKLSFFDFFMLIMPFILLFGPLELSFNTNIIIFFLASLMLLLISRKRLKAIVSNIMKID